MLWLIITIIAYFFNAIAITVDKFLLAKKIKNPAVYAFFISFLNLIVLVLIPFGFHSDNNSQIIIALAAGVLFTFALLYMFKALAKNEASRVTPFMGGLQPIFIFFLAWFFLSEKLSWQALVAFFVIISGTVAISWQTGKADKKSYLFALIAAAFFAVSYTLNKYVFLNQGFISGLIWTRLGAFLGALLLLLKAQNRLDISNTFKKPARGSGKLFIFGQVCGGLSFILVNYAIAISQSVALVNALQGLQYIFLLAIVFLLAQKFPRTLEEKITSKIIAQKIMATALIIIGLFLLFI